MCRARAAAQSVGRRRPPLSCSPPQAFNSVVDTQSFAPPPSAAPGSHDLAAGGATPPEAAVELARIFPGGEYGIEMQVRDYELDQFSVVNNAVYSSYFQHGRHEAFAALGHDVDEYARRGTPLALSELNIRFRAPLRSRDVFRVTVSVQKVTGARVVFHQRILKRPKPSGQGEVEQEELIADAEAVVVFLDSQYRPSRLPKDAARRFQQLADLRRG